MDAVVVASPAELASSSDVIGLCLYDGAATDEVVFGRNGLIEAIRPGTVLAVHSTVGPGYVTDLADRMARLEVSVLDAPVSGGPAAATGELLVMVGGSNADVEVCSPMFATYANRVVRLGRVGAAQAAKLVNNSLMTAITGLVFDAFDIGSALGIDGAGLGEVLSCGSASNPSVPVYLNLGAEQFSYRAWPTLHKDVALLKDLRSDSSFLIQAASATIAEMARRRADLIS
jgi:3-hydroxyisobutyrate dehydrogenase-like beta-hydroxyacid dehydrogenase